MEGFQSGLARGTSRKIGAAHACRFHQLVREYEKKGVEAKRILVTIGMMARGTSYGGALSDCERDALPLPSLPVA